MKAMADKKLKNKFGGDKASKSSEAPRLSPKLIMDSAQHIWLAGLGAFSKAQEEGGKLFEALIREGSKLEEKTRKLTTSKVDEVRGAVESAVGQAQKRATDSWDKLEKVFEGRVSKALEGLGVPSNDDIQTLTKRVEELSAMVKQLKSGESKPTSKPAPKPVLKVVASNKPAAKAPAKPAAKPASKPLVSKAAAKTAAPSKPVASAVKAAAPSKPVATKKPVEKSATARVKAAVSSAEKRVSDAATSARKSAASVVNEIREIAQSLAAEKKS
jgi:poly(hydroxyalkanoate) granule-associated protein